jgi:hypothetical protein
MVNNRTWPLLLFYVVICHPVANNDDAMLRVKAQAAVRDIVSLLIARKG